MHNPVLTRKSVTKKKTPTRFIIFAVISHVLSLLENRRFYNPDFVDIIIIEMSFL